MACSRAVHIHGVLYHRSIPSLPGAVRPVGKRSARSHSPRGAQPENPQKCVAEVIPGGEMPPVTFHNGDARGVGEFCDVLQPVFPGG